MFIKFLLCVLSVHAMSHDLSELIANQKKYNLPVRLHLGCGEQHFPDYINIDFPLDQHTAQTRSGADVFQDIRAINYEPNSIDEIRHHHMFEHFDRATALALVCKWHEALKLGGILYIETPDSDMCMQRFVSHKTTYAQKQIILRHLFGSHEAAWACHWDGWYNKKYKHVFSLLGFEIISIEQHGSSVLPSITMKARKVKSLTRQELFKNCVTILSESLVDRSTGELGILDAWIAIIGTYLK